MGTLRPPTAVFHAAAPTAMTTAPMARLLGDYVILIVTGVTAVSFAAELSLVG